MVYPDGSKYDGQWKNGERSGQGKYVSREGDMFEGEWKEDNLNGKGTSILINGNKYEGEWKDGTYSGYGTYIFSGGVKFEGQWEDGDKSGKGEETYPNGDKYKGEWKNDKLNGHGTYFWPDGSRYENQYINGESNGQAIYTDSFGKKQSQYLEDCKTIDYNGLIEVNGDEPCKYAASEKRMENILYSIKPIATGDFCNVIINDIRFTSFTELIEFSFNKLISPSGYIMIRINVPDLYRNGYFSKFSNMIRKFILRDNIEFIAQCINENYTDDKPIVTTILLGITLQKRDDLIGKLRFISMQDKLESVDILGKNQQQWENFGVPFSREECLSQIIFNEISNDKIDGLYPWEYVPLNNSEFGSHGIEIGEFMELSNDSYQGKVKSGFDFESYLLSGKSQFDPYTKFVFDSEEKFGDHQHPYYLRRIITESAILFCNVFLNSVQNFKLEPLLILNPQEPISTNIPSYRDHEYLISIQVKPEWKEKVDIEYVFLELRKPEFAEQFYYYHLNGHFQNSIRSSTILKAKIDACPSIEDQREIVKKEKEKYFALQKVNLESQQALLNFEDKKKSLEKQLEEMDENILIVKRNIVNDDTILKKTIDLCSIISESVREKVKEEMYYILPIKKCFDQGFSCSTKEVGNKVRKVLEGIILTLKDIQIIPGSYDVGSSIDELCKIIQKEEEMSVKISKFLQEYLPKLKSIGNDGSHLISKQNVPQSELVKAISVLIALMDWLKELELTSNIVEKYTQRVNNIEQKTPEGNLRRSGLLGVITSEWINKAGKKNGAWVVLYDGKKTEISISSQKIRENNLGFGSIIEVNAINKGWGWETEQIKVVTPCPEIYRYKVEYYRKGDDNQK